MVKNMKSLVNIDILSKLIKEQTNLEFTEESMKYLLDNVQKVLEDIVTDILLDLQEICKVCDTNIVKKKHLEYVLSYYLTVEEEE